MKKNNNGEDVKDLGPASSPCHNFVGVTTRTLHCCAVRAANVTHVTASFITTKIAERDVGYAKSTNFALGLIIAKQSEAIQLNFAGTTTFVLMVSFNAIMITMIIKIVCLLVIID